MVAVRKLAKKKKIPQHILEAFCHVLQCEMDGRGNPVKDTYDAHLQAAIRAQQNIGRDMMMRGFLAKGWLDALIRQGVPTPEQKMNALQEIVWLEITLPLWRERNDIKHDKTEDNKKRNTDTLDDQIQWFQKNKYVVLSYHDQFLANMDTETPTHETSNNKNGGYNSWR